MNRVSTPIQLNRASTPTQRFIFPESVRVDTLADVLITYKQGGNAVLEKRLADLTVSGQTLSFKLTQEEANRFDPRWEGSVQLRVLTLFGDSFPSKAKRFRVNDVLNDEVMK